MDRCDTDMSEGDGEDLPAGEEPAIGCDLGRCPMRGGGPDIDEEPMGISSGGGPPPAPLPGPEE